MLSVICYMVDRIGVSIPRRLSFCDIIRSVLEADLIPVIINVLVRSSVSAASSLSVSSLESLSMNADSRRGRVATITHCNRMLVRLQSPQPQNRIYQPGGIAR